MFLTVRRCISWKFHGNIEPLSNLSKIGERERLKPRKGDEPHWQRLRFGCFLGFRPSQRGGKGTWIARAYDPDTGKYSRKALGDYGHFAGHEVFAEAKRDAESWADTVEIGKVPPKKLETVIDACRAYAAENPNAEGSLRRTVYSNAIAKVKLDRLREHHFQIWRKNLEEAPSLITRSKSGPVLTRRRSKATINRDMVPLRAALRRALALGALKSDSAWREILKPYKGADNRRQLYLDRNERKRILDTVDAELEPFVRALCLLPLRPGALASLKVRDFEKSTRTLTVRTDKSGAERKIAVPDVIAIFLNKHANGKLPLAPLLSQANGRAWNKDAWKKPIKIAIRNAGLPNGATAYTLRHSVITDLIRAGLPILTVAQLSGTSVNMIERHYGHLVRNDAEQALEGLVL